MQVGIKSAAEKAMRDVAFSTQHYAAEDFSLGDSGARAWVGDKVAMGRRMANFGQMMGFLDMDNDPTHNDAVAEAWPKDLEELFFALLARLLLPEARVDETGRLKVTAAQARDDSVLLQVKKDLSKEEVQVKVSSVREALDLFMNDTAQRTAVMDEVRAAVEEAEEAKAEAAAAAAEEDDGARAASPAQPRQPQRRFVSLDVALRIVVRAWQTAEAARNKTQTDALAKVFHR